MSANNPDGKEIAPEAMERFAELMGVQRHPVPLELAAVFGWPWQPFREHSPDECRINLGRRLRGQLELRGHAQPDIPNRPLAAHLAEGHIGAIKEAGGLASILGRFLEKVPAWNPLDPDWAGLERLLLTTYRVPPSILPTLTLVEIRRYLTADPQAEQPKRSHKRKVKRSGQKRKMTPTQMAILARHLQGHSVTEIAKDRQTSVQNISKVLKAAVRNQGSLSERSVRSVHADTNTERLEQRGRHLKASDDGHDGDDGDC